MRTAGVLLPIFSLPGKYGIGSLGEEAFRFADQLHKAGQSFWQILPLGPTGYGDSPYQPFSTFAGNPYFIDLSVFPEEILKKEAVEACRFGSDSPFIDYGTLYEERLPLLFQAYQVENYLGLESRYPDFTAFCNENAFWLSDYGLFMALKEEHGGRPWYEWEEGLRRHEEAALLPYRKKLGDRIRFYCWLQYHFARQWRKLRTYVNGLGIRFIGDLPIYVALDSADVWGNPELFQLDEARRPRFVAGVPPDAFSSDGQLWGNPVYDWEAHRRQGYDWWIKRIRHALSQLDLLRMDHFRGFASYYRVPFGDTTAQNGNWEKGPGMELFRRLQEVIPELPVIAEDLGILTDEVRELLLESGFPGMKVLEFAFDSEEESDYLPHRWQKNCVAYTGTHDNDTLCTWLDGLTEKKKARAADYLCLQGRKKQTVAERNETVIRMAFLSAADTVIIPFQDWKGLGAEARINRPAAASGNWQWRMEEGAFDDGLARRMAHVTKLYGRMGARR